MSNGYVHSQRIRKLKLTTKNITENGTYTPDAGIDGFSQVNVNVAGGGGGGESGEPIGYLVKGTTNAPITYDWDVWQGLSNGESLSSILGLTGAANSYTDVYPVVPFSGSFPIFSLPQSVVFYYIVYKEDDHSVSLLCSTVSEDNISYNIDFLPILSFSQISYLVWDDVYFSLTQKTQANTWAQIIGSEVTPLYDAAGGGGGVTTTIAYEVVNFTLNKDNWNGTSYDIDLSEYTNESVIRAALTYPINDTLSNAELIEQCGLSGQGGLYSEDSYHFIVSAIEVPTEDVVIGIAGLVKKEAAE